MQWTCRQRFEAIPRDLDRTVPGNGVGVLSDSVRAPSALDRGVSLPSAAGATVVNAAGDEAVIPSPVHGGPASRVRLTWRAATLTERLAWVTPAAAADAAPNMMSGVTPVCINSLNLDSTFSMTAM